MTGLTFEGLHARGLTLARGERRLFVDLSFDLGPGRLLRLVGPNGSGKSSLLRALLGLAPLRAGQLSWGHSGQAITPRAVCGIALYQGHAAGAKGELTPEENLELSARLDGSLSPRDPAALEGALARVGLARQRSIETRRLSQGQRQRLALARFALALQAPVRPVWLMDEPSAALDAAGAGLLAELLGEHLGRGGAALVATHLPVQPGQGEIADLAIDAFAPAAAGRPPAPRPQ